MTQPTDSTRPKARWQGIALPTEHGGWGFLLEPILLGLLAAFSWAGMALSVATVAGFLLRQPLKSLMIERRRGRRSPRARLALNVSLLYAGIGAAGLGMALWLAGWGWLLPPLLALPLFGAFLYYDLTQPGRTLIAEITAPVGLASVAASMGLMAGWDLWPSLALWLILTARAVPAVLYVRARIRLERGRPTDLRLPTLAHAAALLGIALLVGVGGAPWLALIPFALLLARCWHGLSPRRWQTSIKAVGFMELGLGILTMMMVGAGW